MMWVAVLSLAALASGAVTIRAQQTRIRPLVYAFKPLATLLLLVIATLARSAEPLVRSAMVAGLAFSLAGDVFLMLPERLFPAGLGAFLCAHLCYIVALSARLTAPPAWALYLPFGAFAVGMCSLLGRRAGEMRYGVLLYALAITAMAWLAVTLAVQAPGTPAFRAAAGALLFLASDTALGVNRFILGGSDPRAPLVVLGTYYPGQWLLALSLYP